MTHDDLKVGQLTVFDVRGEKVGKITRLYEVNGVRFADIMHAPSVGFVETHRVGMARIYPNFPVPRHVNLPF